LVLVTSRSFGSGAADPEGMLAAAGLRAVRADPGHDVRQLTAVLGEAAGWIAGTGPIRMEHFDRAPRLRIVARYGTGVDAVDLDAAAERDIVVTNTPGANAEAVAEHALALLLACLRHVVAGDRMLREGTEKTGVVGRELSSLTVGLVGMGHVGRAFARRLLALGATVLGSDPAVHHEDLERIGVRWSRLTQLVESSDVVSLHCPGGGSPVLDGELLNAMRPGAVVINTARADVVDEEALAALLHQGTLAGAAVDVTSDTDSPLRSAPRTILTPHIAGHTVGAIDRMGMMAAADVVRVLVEDEPPLYPVPGSGRKRLA
jgi:D-3-phosphoglycerate dehydrogenase